MSGVWGTEAGASLTQIKDEIISFAASVFVVRGEVPLTVGG